MSMARGPMHPDFSPETLRVQRDFTASPFRLSRAWTDPKHLIQWWGPASFAMGPGRALFAADGRFTFHPRTASGEVVRGRLQWLVLSPPRFLSHLLSFVDVSGQTVRHPHDPRWPLELYQEVHFETLAEGTRLVLLIRPHTSASAEERANFLDAHAMVGVATEVLLDQLLDYLAEATEI